MNRNDLVHLLAERAGLKAAHARHVLDLLFGTGDGAGAIADALDRGERVSIAGFGTFLVRERRARQVRDPKSGEPREVRARRLASFRPGNGLRDRVR